MQMTRKQKYRRVLLALAALFLILAVLLSYDAITGKEFMEIFHQVIAKRNGNAEEAVENPENTALPEADFTVNPEV